MKKKVGDITIREIAEACKSCNNCTYCKYRFTNLPCHIDFELMTSEELEKEFDDET